MLKCCVRDWFLWERCGCDGVYLIVYTHNCVLIGQIKLPDLVVSVFQLCAKTLHNVFFLTDQTGSLASLSSLDEFTSLF